MKNDIVLNMHPKECIQKKTKTKPERLKDLYTTTYTNEKQVNLTQQDNNNGL